MKVSCAQLETPIVLDDEHPFVLCVENPHEFYRVTREFVFALGGEQSEFTFWENDLQIRADKFGEILTDLFSFELTDKKITALLYKYLQQNIMSGTLLFRFQEVRAEVDRFMADLCASEDFALDYEEISLETLLKGCSLKSAKNYEGLLEKLICYLNLYVQLKGITFFVFIGLKSVLTDDELLLLYRHCSLHKISLLLIENGKVHPLLACEKAIIITEDLCELVENIFET